MDDQTLLTSGLTYVDLEGHLQHRLVTPQVGFLGGVSVATVGGAGGSAGSSPMPSSPAPMNFTDGALATFGDGTVIDFSS